MVESYVDAHVHFWDTSLRPYPWLAGVSGLGGRYTPDSLEAEVVQCAGAVFVQADCAPSHATDEVEWVEELAKRHPWLLGVVAHVPMDQGNATRTALDLMRAHRLVRGVRHSIQDEPDPMFCARPEFVAGVRYLGELGLTFDVCVKPAQLPAVMELVAACPATEFVLDHGGKPNIRAGTLEPWRSQIIQLGRLPNLWCKLSGLVTEAGTDWGEDQLAPFMNVLWEVFGERRLMFGSDWPVVNLAGSHARWLSTVSAWLTHRGSDAAAAVFTHNAQTCYRLR